MARARIALVGAGMMGTNHARVIAQSELADLALVVDPRESVGRALAERSGAAWSPEVPESFTGIDAVVVAAATESHYPLALRVIGDGVPLLIEKPVADDLLRTEEILERAAAADVPLMCGLLERYNPAVITTRRLLGDAHHITTVRHSPYASRIRTGVAWDLLVHDVDLAIQLAGGAPVSTVSERGVFHPDSEGDAEDVAEAVMRFDRGAIAHCSASRIGHRKIRRLSVYEEARLLEVDLLRRSVTIYRHVAEDSQDGEGRGYRQQTIIEIPELVTSQEPLTSQFEAFLELVEGRADAAAERASILPSHVAIAAVTSRPL